MTSHNGLFSGNVDSVTTLGPQGQVVLSNGFFTIPGDVTASEYLLRAKTTDATTTPLLGDGVTTTNQTVLSEDVPAWDTTVTADVTNGALNFNVIGAAATTINWSARVRTVEMIL